MQPMWNLKILADFEVPILFQKLTRKSIRAPNTDVAHYRGQLATTLSSFCSAKTRSSKIGTGRRSIYNICIPNYCKLTFEFFKNYIFEKRRQFLNRIRAAKDSGLCPNHQTQKKAPVFLRVLSYIGAELYIFT